MGFCMKGNFSFVSHVDTDESDDVEGVNEWEVHLEMGLEGMGSFMLAGAAGGGMSALRLLVGHPPFPS